jgi:hypothetical protein
MLRIRSRALGLAGLLLVAACSVRPVHGGAAGAAAPDAGLRAIPKIDVHAH